MYHVPKDTLERLAESGMGLNLAMAAAVFGALISLFSVWLTGEVDDVRHAATLNMMLVMLVVLFIAFGFRAWRDHKKAERELDVIKRQSDGNSAKTASLREFLEKTADKNRTGRRR